MPMECVHVFAYAIRPYALLLFHLFYFISLSLMLVLLLKARRF